MNPYRSRNQSHALYMNAVFGLKVFFMCYFKFVLNPFLPISTMTVLLTQNISGLRGPSRIRAKIFLVRNKFILLVGGLRDSYKRAASDSH